MYFSPAALAAARPASMSAPFSVARRRLMTDTNPSFFSTAIADGCVAPPHPTVASTREKFVMPGTSAFFTCAAAGVPANAATATTIRIFIVKRERGIGFLLPVYRQGSRKMPQAEGSLLVLSIH